MPNPKTVRIESNDTEMGYVIINEASFDPKQHKLWSEDAEKTGDAAEPEAKTTRRRVPSE